MERLVELWNKMEDWQKRIVMIFVESMMAQDGE